MIRAFFQRRKLRREFGKFVDSKTFDELSTDLSSRPLKSGRIDYVLAFVRGESPAEISERVARVASLAATHNAMVYDMVSALVIMAFGTQPKSSPGSGDRSSRVHALHEQLGADIKILHGAADGHYGLFGGPFLVHIPCSTLRPHARRVGQTAVRGDQRVSITASAAIARHAVEGPNSQHPMNDR